MPPREVDARYVPDLDDGVMINSAALWPLLAPQWKDPKKWWKELANAEGKKDYDWAHLAMRYWPTRVDAKCQQDPSLGVAHGCFWKYHPARAWAWELRLQDEIGPDFRIEEPPYRGDGGDTEHRAAYLRDHAEEAVEAIEKEVCAGGASRRRLRPNCGFWNRGSGHGCPTTAGSSNAGSSKSSARIFICWLPMRVNAEQRTRPTTPAGCGKGKNS